MRTLDWEKFITRREVKGNNMENRKLYLVYKEDLDDCFITGEETSLVRCLNNKWEVYRFDPDSLQRVTAVDVKVSSKTEVNVTAE